MKRMANFSLRYGFCIFTWLAFTAASHGASLLRAEAGNVSTSSFHLLYELSESAEVELRVYDQSTGGNNLTDSLRFEWFPVSAVRPLPGSRYAERLDGHVLQDRMRERALVMVRVHHAQPATTYYAELSIPDEGGVMLAGPRLPVTTATRNAFISESRQIVVDLSAAGVDVAGAVVRVSHLNAPYPLFAVLNDGVGFGRAYVDLNHFLDPSGMENAAFTGTTDFTVSLRGLVADDVTTQIPFGGTGFTVATATTLPFAIGGTPGPWDLLVVADPLEAATTSGSGEYEHLAAAPISVVPNPGWRFLFWLGDGIADPYELETSVSVVADTNVTAVLLPADPDEDYALWRQRYFLRNATNPDIAGPSQDPNRNGLPNLLDYAFGLHPVLPNPDQREPQFEERPEGFFMVFHRRTNAPELSVSIETALDLSGPWTDYTPPPAALSITPLEPGIERVEARLPDPADVPVFYRLKVALTEILNP